MILTTLALDQATKALAQALLGAETIRLLGDVIRLELSTNRGAFLSLGAGLSPALRFWIFTVAAAAMVVAITIYAYRTQDLPRDGLVAMAFVSGGGFSNLLDRVAREGHVVDFLNFGIGALRTGILNVADIAIFFGALYVVWAGFRVRPEANAVGPGDGPKA